MTIVAGVPQDCACQRNHPHLSFTELPPNSFKWMIFKLATHWSAVPASKLNYIYIYVYNLNLRVLLPSDVEDSGSHPSFLAPELFKYLLPYWISALPIPTSLAMTSKTSPPRPMISPMPCPKLNCLVNAWEAPSNSETKLRRDLELGKSGSYKCDRNMQLSASWIDISTHVSLSKKPTGIAGNQHEPSQSW